jgi:hypothetical protein
MYAGPLPTDRRAIAASLCQLLAQGAEDQNVSLEQLGNAARQIAEFLLDDERRQQRPGRGPKLSVIEGGLK